MKMWSGRISGPLDPGFERWQRSFGFDRRLLPYECAASRAHARALANAGLISRQELNSILAGLNEIEQGCAADPALFERSDAEDVHHFVEQQLALLVGDVGLKLHTGRSRNEQIAADLRLFCRDAIDQTRERLCTLGEVLCDRAEGQNDAPMPSYTHLQRAEPIYAAHWLLAYVQMFLRDAERLADCRRRVNVLPLGSGAVAGASFNLDRNGVARELGFEGISANSMDATSDRDFAIEFLNGLALIALHLSRMAEDFILYSTPEFGFVRLPDSFATGSSAMPQKKNPDVMELVRGKTARIFAAAQQLQLTMKGLPLAYNRDLQETQEPVFAAADSIVETLAIVAGFIGSVEFDRERMRAAAASGFLNATAAANYLVTKGVSFRRAHSIAGEMVRHCLDRGVTLESLSPEELHRFSPEFGADFSAVLRLESVINAHDVPGGTASDRIHDAIVQARSQLAQSREAAVAHA
jgi:argininosuccinate lyase